MIGRQDCTARPCTCSYLGEQPCPFYLERRDREHWARQWLRQVNWWGLLLVAVWFVALVVFGYGVMAAR